MTFEQTVTIPENRRLHLDLELPDAMPQGAAFLKLIPIPCESALNSTALVSEASLREAPSRWLRGCCKNLPGGSVDDFLAHCRSDKEQELAVEKRQEEERARRA
jgi:hypothetical protein